MPEATDGEEEVNTPRLPSEVSVPPSAPASSTTTPGATEEEEVPAAAATTESPMDELNHTPHTTEEAPPDVDWESIYELWRRGDQL